MTNANNFCDQCGARLNATSRYCPSCGGAIDTDGSPKTENLANQTSNVSSTRTTRPCPACGTQNARFADVCHSCDLPLPIPPGSGDPQSRGNFRRRNQPVARRGRKPSNYLPQAILVTLFCCIPAGVVAIFYAAQVNSKWASGFQYQAEDASSSAKQWCWIGIFLGFGIGFIYGFYNGFLSAF